MGYRVHCDWCGEALYQVDKAVLPVTIARERSNELEAKWAADTLPTLHFCVSAQTDHESYKRMGLRPVEDLEESCFDRALAAIKGTKTKPPDMGMEWRLVSVGGSPRTVRAEVADSLGTETVAGVEPALRAVLARLSYRARLALPRAGIRTLEQLSSKTDEELLEVPGVGQGTLQTIRATTGPGPDPEREIDPELTVGDLYYASVRTFNALLRAGVTDVASLARMTEEEVLALPGIGEQGLDEIRRSLERIGLRLGHNREEVC